MMVMSTPEIETSSNLLEITNSDKFHHNIASKNTNLHDSIQTKSLNHIYNKLVGQKKEAKVLKNLLTNLHNKLTTIDTTLEISFESIQTKIK